MHILKLYHQRYYGNGIQGGGGGGGGGKGGVTYTWMVLHVIVNTSNSKHTYCTIHNQ